MKVTITFRNNKKFSTSVNTDNQIDAASLALKKANRNGVHGCVMLYRFS